jgi:Sulfite exporter TauE/SafE
VLGALSRVCLLPDGSIFKALVSVLLLPLGVWLLVRDQRPTRRTGALAPGILVTLGFAAGLVGGIYGIGGGSLLAPVLVASGYLVASVAPAALLSTFVTSCVGAATYAVLAVTGRPPAAPDWHSGIACGLGGLVGGYLGGQPPAPPAATDTAGFTGRSRVGLVARLVGRGRPRIGAYRAPSDHVIGPRLRVCVNQCGLVVARAHLATTIRRFLPYEPVSQF